MANSDYAIVYKIYPNLKQTELAHNNINISRFIYNKTLEYNIFSYEQLGKSLSPKVTDLKCDFPFLNLVEFDSELPEYFTSFLNTLEEK